MAKKINISEKIINEMIERHKEGDTLDILSNDYNVSRMFISRIMRDKGYKPLNNKELPLKDDKYIDLYFLNNPLNIIADKYFISYSTLIRRLHKAGAIIIKRQIYKVFCNLNYDDILNYIDINKIINIVKYTDKSSSEKVAIINGLVKKVKRKIS